jgi:hypothetical protein
MKMRRAVDQSYLLRLWADQIDDPLRATLVPVAQPGVRHHFASLDELLAFLATRAHGSPAPESPGEPDADTTTP